MCVDAAATIESVDWGWIVATVIRLVGDFDLAEECAQRAFSHRAHLRDSLLCHSHGLEKRLVAEYSLWGAWNRFQQAEVAQMVIQSADCVVGAIPEAIRW